MTIRVAYSDRDVEEVTAAIGRPSGAQPAPATDADIANLERRTAEPARKHVDGVVTALRNNGFTGYNPVSRDPKRKSNRDYLRWELRWPNGTVTSLYQEPSGVLGTHAKMVEDRPEYFFIQYGVDTDGDDVTAEDVAAELARYVDRIRTFDASRPAHRR
ncbi:hypothetical protein Athai_13880 [Actinocatenispora thailandica]|uniref:Uncharacterized protein n=2 Tax=Actinocatenispora thailandica TaxID=227318 RepID=A0A7R7DLI0_9ACTN|nr:hypothetical protein [Actinocatenispora thailandica]BCJ33885.1 hypothetical protein Athai_13880 [Actinocatenispora thailandica]